MVRSRLAVLLGAFCAFGLLGLLFPAIGASLPAIGREFGIGVERAGLILTAFQLGYTAVCLLGGVLCDVSGRRPALAAGVALYGAGALLLARLARPSGFAATCLLFALLGCGAGLIYISSNTLVIELYPERRGAVLNLHHLSYALGTLTAPLLVGAAVRSWHTAYARFGLVGLSLALFFLIVRAPAEPARVRGPGALRAKRAQREEYARLLGNRLFLLLLGTGLLAIGVQFAITYLLVSLLVEGRGLPLPRAALVLSLFFLAVASGRLLTSWLASRWSNTRLILGSLVLLSLTLLSAWLARGTLSLVLFVASGLAFSAMMPSLLALASVILSRQVMGAALGLVATAAGLGGVLLPSLASRLAGTVGLDRGFLVVVGTAALATVGFALLQGRFLRAESTASRRDER